MSSRKFFSLDHGCKPADLRIEPKSAIKPIVCIDGSSIDGTIYYQADWIMEPLTQEGLVKHDSDKLLVFLGTDPDDHEALGADVELWLENDKLTLTETCVVFVPKGVAHGRMSVKNVRRPFINYFCLMNSSFYQAEPAEASAPAGTYAGNVVVKYEPVDGYLPPAPEGFLTRLIWLDGVKLAGAPYMEAVRFHTRNDEGPEMHAHDFDELIGFLGMDPQNPDELHGEVTLYIDGETVGFTKSCVAYIPRDIMHSPILVPRLDQSIFHFSGGNGGDYARRDEENKDSFRA
ncbi:MAG: hypothetical protein FWH33_10755 [Oscillospiraceae bacterium]|nr:hypothetical protein [Oscillospiraceae bacterium]